jgi:hypothetical protein
MSHQHQKRSISNEAIEPPTINFITGFCRGVLDNHLQVSQSLPPLSKGDFFALCWPAWVSTFTENLISKAFTATGICPVNPDVILDRFRHTSPESLESVSSGSTAYSADDWLKACTTLQAEVKNSRSVGARKLGQTIHHLSSQVELLQVEVDGLRKKLYQKDVMQYQLQLQRFLNTN